MTTVDGDSGVELRTSMLAIRLTPSEHELIRQKATGLGVSVTDFVVRAALGVDALAPRKANITNQGLERRIERIERVLVDAGVILDPGVDLD